jgi:hypothetical protein
MMGFIAAHFLIALALAPMYDTWPTTLIVGGAGALMFLVSVVLLPRHFITAAWRASRCRRSWRCTSTRCTAWRRCTSGSSPRSR